MSKPKTEELEICNKYGLHTRTAGRFAKLASEFESEVFVTKNEETVDGKSILDLLTLAAAKKTKIILTVKGSDQEKAFQALKDLVLGGFGEEM